MKTVAQIVNGLRAGQQVKISGDNTNYFLVERSGNGKILRYVRVLGNETTVVKKMDWMCR